jgi:hypothetical protein
MVSGLVFLSPDGLEPYKDTHPVLDAVLGIPNQLAHDLPDYPVDWLLLLVRFGHTPHQLLVVELGQVWLPPRAFQPWVDLVWPSLTDSSLLSRLDRRPGLG